MIWHQSKPLHRLASDHSRSEPDRTRSSRRGGPSDRRKKSEKFSKSRGRPSSRCRSASRRPVALLRLDVENFPIAPRKILLHAPAGSHLTTIRRGKLLGEKFQNFSKSRGRPSSRCRSISGRRVDTAEGRCRLARDSKRSSRRGGNLPVAERLAAAAAPFQGQCRRLSDRSTSEKEVHSRRQSGSDSHR